MLFIKISPSILEFKHFLPVVGCRFDWYQSGETVSVIVYTKWPTLTEEAVMVDLHGTTLLLTLYIQQAVYTVHIGRPVYTVHIGRPVYTVHIGRPVYTVHIGRPVYTVHIGRL